MGIRLVVAAALAVALAATPVWAQVRYNETFRCVDNGGEVYIGRGTPPAWCREERELAAPRPLTGEEEYWRIAHERAAAQLSEELGQRFRALLENARGVSEMLAAGPYDGFALRVWAIAQQIQSIRAKYAVPLRNGDHKLLGAAVSEACSALYAAGADWKKEQRAAADLASAQKAAAWTRATGTTTLTQLEALRIAQQQYEQAKMQLATSKESVSRLMAHAMKVARGDDERPLRASAPSP
jgi:hypothetical protein